MNTEQAMENGVRPGQDGDAAGATVAPPPEKRPKARKLNAKAPLPVPPRAIVTIREAPAKPSAKVEAKVEKALGKARKAVSKALKALGKAERALNKAQRTLEKSAGGENPPARALGLPVDDDD
jgi:hypothetical protein